MLFLAPPASPPSRSGVALIRYSYSQQCQGEGKKRLQRPASSSGSCRERHDLWEAERRYTSWTSPSTRRLYTMLQGSASGAGSSELRLFSFRRRAYCFYSKSRDKRERA